MFGVPRQYPVVVHVRVCACAYADMHVDFFSDAPVDVEGFLLVQIPVFMALRSKSQKITLIKS